MDILLTKAMMSPVVGVLMTDAGTGEGEGGTNIGAILENLRNSLGNWGTYIVGILGVAALIVGIWNIVTGMISHGKKQTNWLISIGLLVLGAVMMTWTLGNLQNVSNSGDVNDILHDGVTSESGATWGSNGE